MTTNDYNFESDHVRYSEHFNVDNMRQIFSSIVDYAGIKSYVGVLLVLFNWVFDTNENSILVVGALIVIDTISGVAKALKLKTLSSTGFFRFAMKCLVYFLLMATGSLLDKALPMRFAFPIMLSFLAVTEGISIMENLGMLGFPVPINLLRRLKVMRQEMTDSPPK